jgi:hypothetical protein
LQQLGVCACACASRKQEFGFCCGASGPQWWLSVVLLCPCPCPHGQDCLSEILAGQHGRSGARWSVVWSICDPVQTGLIFSPWARPVRRGLPCQYQAYGIEVLSCFILGKVDVLWWRYLLVGLGACWRYIPRWYGHCGDGHATSLSANGQQTNRAPNPDIPHWLMIAARQRPCKRIRCLRLQHQTRRLVMVRHVGCMTGKCHPPCLHTLHPFCV